MKQIIDITEFQEMLASPRAITFLHARWSIYSVNSRKLFHDFYNQSSRSAWTIGTELSFWEIDISDQLGEIWDVTCTWLESQKVDSVLMMVCGGGAIIWSESSAIKKTVPSALRLNSLLNTTREAFR